MTKTPASELLIGAHTSAAGGAHNALLHGEEIGATTIQFFTSNQKRWEGKPIGPEEIALWNEAAAKTGIKTVMSHDSYLINLGSPNEEGLCKSRKAFKEEIKRCHALHVTYLNFHPGAALDGTVEHCLDTIVKSLESLELEISKGKTRILLETTAGQGSSVGYRFEHLGYIIEHLHKKIPIGVCIDTCHIFSAGYDIRTKKGWDETIQEFDRVIGIKHLYALHVNDSLKPFGARKDRHAELGQGEIGPECFKAMMEHPDLRELPKYLETPDPDQWKKEIQMLRDYA